jgi:hypothetical protein
MEEPLAELEREPIAAHMTGAGYDLEMLLKRADELARQLLTEALALRDGR